jgi:hypothetical protein
MKAAGVVIDSAVDHGVSESLYLRDPDQNGVELSWDRPSELWWDRAGELKMGNRPMGPTRIVRQATPQGVMPCIRHTSTGASGRALARPIWCQNLPAFLNLSVFVNVIVRVNSMGWRSARHVTSKYHAQN